MTRDQEPEDGDGSVSPTRTSVSDAEPSELFTNMDTKVIETVSKFMAKSTSQATSASTSNASMSMSASTSSAASGPNMGIPVLCQQPMKMIPGVLTASVQRRRTKSLEEPLPVEGAPAVVRKEKNKLQMTKM
jgi:hypothetical protein